VKAIIYIEGGGDSKELHVRCREGFRKLLESSGFKGKMPRLVACGGRGSTCDDFKTAHASNKAEYMAILIDSEAPVTEPEQTWEHLKVCEDLEQPDGADDEQVLFMTTCMETWIIADLDTLRRHYGSNLQESALPSLVNLEQRDHHYIQDSLKHATRKCSNAYTKGKRSFEVLGKLTPQTLETYLASFQRVIRILNEKLN
jgi:hypothetical protein